MSKSFERDFERKLKSARASRDEAVSVLLAFGHMTIEEMRSLTLGRHDFYRLHERSLQKRGGKLWKRIGAIALRGLFEKATLVQDVAYCILHAKKISKASMRRYMARMEALASSFDDWFAVFLVAEDSEDIARIAGKLLKPEEYEMEKPGTYDWDRFRQTFGLLADDVVLWDERARRKFRGDAFDTRRLIRGFLVGS